MIRYILSLVIIGTALLNGNAQYFSENDTIFFRQAMSVINGVGTEPAKKVAYDFNNAWNSKFTSAHQSKIASIAIQMEKKGYTVQPHFWYFFTYLAYSVSQAGVDREELTTILNINDQMVKSMNSKEYTHYLLGMSMFMARKILGFSNKVQVWVDNGTHQFKILDAPPPPDDEPEELTEEELFAEPVVVEEPILSGDDNAWSNTDPWGTSSGWGDSDWGFSDAWSKDETQEEESAAPKRQVVISTEHNYLTEKVNRYNHPDVSGPVIELRDHGMVIATPYDSLLIKEVSGHFLLRNRVFAGTEAVMNWPEQNIQFRGAEVSLGEFHLKADRSDFWTPHAHLTFPALFGGSVEGVYHFTSVPRKPRTLSSQPTFTSNRSDVTLNFPGNRLKYTGGIELSGNRLYGRSVSKDLSTLQILDGKGNTVVIRSAEFVFEDSVVTSQAGKLSILHGSDSLYHPSANLRYDQRTEELVLYRTKQYNVTPFQSTYFDVNINVDLIKWNMRTDSIDLSILNGKDLISATVESDKFFNHIRFKKLSGFFAFHPLVTSVYYANKYGLREFNAGEIATEFKTDINQVKGAMKMLKQYGFAEYDENTGQVILNDRAFHYHKASGGKVDFDNLLIPSLEPDKPNMTWDIAKGELIVRGVKEFYVTSNFDVKIKPDSSEVKVLQGRDLEFNGRVEAGNFKYSGKNFNFIYDEFLVHMPEIDSIRIEIPIPDSLRVEGEPGKSSLSNQLNESSGTLYIDDPDNKAGIAENASYPYLSTDGESIVYFDGSDVLNGAYDKSVKFLIPPFQMDSIERNDQTSISFEGRFNSGGIFPEFEETLRIMPDQSLGFIHQIPPEGYNLYGMPAKTYEKITISNEGIRGGGKIDFITTTIYSDDFIYYPDSVSAVGTGGVINPGAASGASYPEAELGPFQMLWLPRKDSMYLQNIGEPFKFYHSTATLDGEANITSKGVFGSGILDTRGSRSTSKVLSFKENSYAARHAHFEVFSTSEVYPAMLGEDVRLDFDLINNNATIKPEKSGVAAISFPFAQMKTSITNAVWDLEDSVVTMTKPKNIPLEESYFYSTRKELDSLAFYGTEASYDINTYELQIKGIPYIIVADAKIIPENNQTTILEYATLQPFNNARIIIDTLNGYHNLSNGRIKIISRNEFEGSAHYELVSLGDTFDIVFNQFMLENVKVNEKETRLMTVSEGEVEPEQNLRIAPGFFFKGAVTMYAYKQALELDGAVKIDLDRPGYDKWIEYDRTDDETAVKIDFETTKFDDKTPLVAGLHYDLRGKLYATFIEERKSPADEDFFYPKGVLTYDTAYHYFKIETPGKSSGESYGGYTLTYNDETKDIIFEGNANFFNSLNTDVSIASSVLGVGNAENQSFQLDALLTIDAPGISDFLEIMAQDLIDLATRLGLPAANDIKLETLYKLANMTSDALAKEYETESLKDYVALYDLSPNLLKPLVISGVKLDWSETHGAWYNTTKLAISNVMKKDVNSKMDGFLEFKKDISNNDDVMNLFIQPSPGTWYFMSYHAGTFSFYSSNESFNEKVLSMSNYGVAKAGELVIVEADVNETLGFVNDFRRKYYNITTPYNLEIPGDVDFGKDEFETIEEKKDTDFGF